MTIHLPAELERFVHDQVLAGRYPSEDDVIRDALENLRSHAPTPMTSPRMTEAEFKQHLLKSGRISSLPTPAPPPIPRPGGSSSRSPSRENPSRKPSSASGADAWPRSSSTPAASSSV